MTSVLKQLHEGVPNWLVILHDMDDTFGSQKMISCEQKLSDPTGRWVDQDQSLKFGDAANRQSASHVVVGVWIMDRQTESHYRAAEIP
jgi:hypothetical protein